MRKPGWEKRLIEVVNKHSAVIDDYSISNCYIIADDAVFACLERRINKKLYNGKPGPKTEHGAAKQLLKHGFKNVKEAFASEFEMYPSVLFAKRGDIGIIENEGQLVGGVYTSNGFMTRSASQILWFSITETKFAFKVE